MKKIKIGNDLYLLEKNYRDCFVYEDLVSKFTDYFSAYDYVLGDYSYDKLRLKGFYNSQHKKVSPWNDICYIDGYIVDYCAYDAKYFLLKKLK